MSNESKYQISILGDSISTYAGYNPPENAVYYRDDRLYDNELESVDDTWWMQVIAALQGELVINESFSGSLVAGTSEACGCSDKRCSNLHAAQKPNLILVYMGTNDCGTIRNIGMERPNDCECFYGAYRTMLQKIKRNYPEAKIVCATLPTWQCGGWGGEFAEEFARRAVRYNDAIKAAVQEESCLLADLACFDERYESNEDCHPNKRGHAQLASLWLKALECLL